MKVYDGTAENESRSIILQDGEKIPVPDAVASVTLQTFELIDDWMKDNQYILTHYRPMSNSFSKSFASLFAIHNETVNIWTHFLPATFICAMATYIAAGYYGVISRNAVFARWSAAVTYPSTSRGDVIMLLIFVLGSFVMFTASWTYHTVSNHSHVVAKSWNKFDYAGIIFMILGSFCPSVYYGHYCNPDAIRQNLSLVGGFGFITFCFTVLDRFRTSDWRPYRAAMFVALGSSAVLPIGRALVKKSMRDVHNEMSLWYCVAEGIFYIGGAFVYAKRTPEKNHPCKFDVLGSSHQIFHVCIVIAGSLHAIGLWKAYHWRHGVLHGICPVTQ